MASHKLAHYTSFGRKAGRRGCPLTRLYNWHQSFGVAMVIGTSTTAFLRPTQKRQSSLAMLELGAWSLNLSSMVADLVRIKGTSEWINKISYLSFPGVRNPFCKERSLERIEGICRVLLASRDSKRFAGCQTPSKQ
ncbi:hypothetical protein GOP47_0010667 [Adiantum capillus-veneris]|uniref:Uncharacterized protein n=1 Tax=Adiantum capillus-veneris TaxID=13818 RepID=A0A9D4UVG0_ADICA|nr:hypothetical protein GOP47_0010667 [Adiantum capillus-veneris]